MPLLGTRGAASIRAFGLAGVKSARFIVEHHYTAGASQVVSFSGAVAGQLALIIVWSFSNTNVAPPSGWTALSTITWSAANVTCAFWKVLSSGDISTGSVTVTGMAPAGSNEVAIVVYSGVTSVAAVSSIDTFTSNPSIPGFTKSASSKVIIGCLQIRNVGTAPSSPTGMTNRISLLVSSTFPFGVDDFIPSELYSNGASVTYSAGVTNEAVARLFELS